MAALGAGDVYTLGTTEKHAFMSKKKKKNHNKILSLFWELE